MIGKQRYKEQLIVKLWRKYEWGGVVSGVWIMEDLSKKMTSCRDLNEVQKWTTQRFERGHLFQIERRASAKGLR